MTLLVADNDTAGCYNSKLRYTEKGELGKSKDISCPDIQDYVQPGEKPQITWYKVQWEILWGEFTKQVVPFSEQTSILFTNHLRSSVTAPAPWEFKWSHCHSFQWKHTSFLCKLALLYFMPVSQCCLPRAINIVLLLRLQTVNRKLFKIDRLCTFSIDHGSSTLLNDDYKVL